MSNEKYADVREMYMAHTVFRREFGLLPAAIEQRQRRQMSRGQQIIAQHCELIQDNAASPSSGEDTYLWPRLRGRAARDAKPSHLTAMEAQHATRQRSHRRHGGSAGLAGDR